MSSNQSSELKEFVGKIQQFLSHQIETNNSLDEATKESLSVASECIEQAYSVQRQSASSELFDIYRAHKQNPAGTQSNPMNSIPMNNPANFIQNIVGNILSQATNTADVPSTNPASATSAPQTSSAPPKVRKQATEAEKLAAESYKSQGNDLMKQDKLKEAYDAYSQAINLDDNNAVYYSNRAATLSKMGNHQGALNDCREAIEIDPSYSKAYGRMGLAYASLEDHKHAREAYQKAVELDPSNESYRNNLKIAEENDSRSNVSNTAETMSNMFRSMMGNPEVMNMAMRTLQDPRIRSLFQGNQP